MNSLLANVRWLCLPSTDLGKDWAMRTRELDNILINEGMDLSEEAVYLLFSNNPSDILEGVGQCLVARPVIGPKKVVTPPLSLVDWKASPVWREGISGQSWVELMEGAEEAMSKIQTTAGSLAEDFSLCVRRQLKPDLILSVECIFHE